MFSGDDAAIIQFTGVDFVASGAFVFCVVYVLEATAIFFTCIIVCPLAFLLGNDDISGDVFVSVGDEVVKGHFGPRLRVNFGADGIEFFFVENKTRVLNGIKFECGHDASPFFNVAGACHCK